jgi:hypothetical protein
MWKGSGARESFFVIGHVSWATGVHQSLVLQTSIHHLHRMREGRWLSAGVSEKNLRNLVFNHTIWASLHNSLHLTIWASGTWTVMGKAWTIKVTQLKVRIDTSSGKTMSTRGTNTTMRAWVHTKASRHNTTLSWTKTIWAMVRSMRKMRRSTRRKVRWKINKLIMIWVSSIVHMHLLHSLASKAKIIQVTRTTTKHANVNFLTWIWSIFLHTSLGVEGWLVTRWVVGFG